MDVAVPSISRASFATHVSPPYLKADGGRGAATGAEIGRVPDPGPFPAHAVAQGRDGAEGSGRRGGDPGLGRQGRRARHALRLQGGDRPHVRSGRGLRHRRRAGRGLCHRAIRRRASGQSAQCLVRKGRAACGAKARGPGLPPHPRPQPALPSGTAHRLADQNRRAGHEEHRHDALFPPLQHCADGDRADRYLRHLLREIRCGPGRRHAGNGGDLHRLHSQGHRLASADSARHERGRQQGDRPRRRLLAELRNRQIFRRRGARSEALRRGDCRLHQRRRPQRDLARLAQHRPESHHELDDGRRHDLHRLGVEPRTIHAGRRGSRQRAC